MLVLGQASSHKRTNGTRDTGSGRRRRREMAGRDPGKCKLKRRKRKVSDIDLRFELARISVPLSAPESLPSPMDSIGYGHRAYVSCFFGFLDCALKKIEDGVGVYKPPPALQCPVPHPHLHRIAFTKLPELLICICITSAHPPLVIAHPCTMISPSSSSLVVVPAVPVDQSTAQCCHCGHRNSHASNCPFKG